MGYRKKVGFQSGFIVAQISEFSLILISMGVSLGHLSPEILSLVTIIGLVTISGSVYLIMYSERIYLLISSYLSIFEKKNVKKDIEIKESLDVILFGKNRIGQGLVESFRRNKFNFLVVDYNPDVINELKKDGMKCRYGDASDEEFLQGIDFSKVKMVVSTIPDFETNMLLLNIVKSENPKTLVLITSHNIDEAKELYDAGSTYVLMPHFLGGNYASMIIEKFEFDSKKFQREKENHIRDLDLKKFLGHEHPRRD